MSIKNKYIQIVFLVFISLSLTNCGGGDGGSSDSSIQLESGEVKLAPSVAEKEKQAFNITDKYYELQDVNGGSLDIDSLVNELKTIDGLVIEDYNKANDTEVGYVIYNIDGYEYIIEDSGSKHGWAALVDNNYIASSTINNFRNSNNSSKKALVLAPFSWQVPDTLEYEVVYPLQNAGFDVTYIQNENVTFPDIASVGNYDFVYIATHSNKKGTIRTMIEASDGVWLDDTRNIVKGYLEETGKYYYLVKPDFFSNINFVKKPIFYLHMCQALHETSPLKQRLFNSGAKAVLGWDIIEEFAWSYGLDKYFLTQALQKNSVLQDDIQEFKNNDFYNQLTQYCKYDWKGCEDYSKQNLTSSHWITSFNTNEDIILNEDNSNQSPKAVAGNDQTTTEGNTASFSALGSSDSDGNIASYQWKEGYTLLSTNSTFSKNDFSVGTHTITLTVTDNDGATDTDTVKITVEALPNIVSKYYIPSKFECESNEGTWNQTYNECSATWGTAKNICVLPTKNQWEEVITECEGVINEWDLNKENSSYQQCIKDLGYGRFDGYWSSTTDTLSVWLIFFYPGHTGVYTKDNSKYIRCVKENESITYSWSKGSYGTCTGGCGTDNGTQSRTVTCKSSDNTTLSDSYCSDSKPNSSRICTVSQCSIPSIPNSISASDGTYSDKVSVSWSSTSGATSYELYRSTSSSSTGSKIKTTTSTSYNDTSVTQGLSYYYRVKACNSDGCSSPSNYNSGYAHEAYDSAPTVKVNSAQFGYDNYSSIRYLQINYTAQDSDADNIDYIEISITNPDGYNKIQKLSLGSGNNGYKSAGITADCKGEDSDIFTKNGAYAIKIRVQANGKWSSWDSGNVNVSCFSSSSSSGIPKKRYAGTKTYSNSTSYNINVDLVDNYYYSSGGSGGFSKLYITGGDSNSIQFYTYPKSNPSCKHSFTGSYSYGVISGSFSNPNCADSSNGSWYVEDYWNETIV